MAQRMMACLAIAALAGAVSCADSPVAPTDTVALTVAPATDSVLLTYICGNMFRVRNTSFESREVRWDIYNATPADTGSLWLRGRDVGAAHVDYFVTSRTKGTMRVFVGGVLRQTKANGNKVACAAPVDTSPLPATRSRTPFSISREPRFDMRDSSVVARTLVYVVFRSSATSGQQRAFQRDFNAQIIRRLDDSVWRFRLPVQDSTDAAVTATLASIRQRSAIARAAYVTVLQPAVTHGKVLPSDGAGQRRNDYVDENDGTWWARKLRLPEAWWCENGTYGGVPVRLAVFEHNFAPVPVDLAQSATSPIQTFQWPKPPQDSTLFAFYKSHGIAVAGMVGSKGGNSVGIAGVLWQSDLRLISMGSTAALSYGADEFDETVVPALLAIRPRVLSLSSDFGPYGNLESLSFNGSAAVSAVRTLLDSIPDLLILQAAGNGSANGPAETLPQSERTALQQALLALRRESASYANRIVHVGASTRSGGRWSSSNELVGALDVYAPGDRVRTLSVSGASEERSGTSFATPLVAGIAGQLLTMDPTLRADSVKALLLAGARDSVEGSNGVNAVPNKVGNATGDMYEADSYGSLRLLSARAGTPLCGAHLRPWSNELDNLSLIFVSTRAVRYQSGVQENLPDFSLSQQSLAPGGRLFAGMSSHLMSFANGVWQPYQTVPDSARRVFSERDTLTWFTPLDTNSQPVMQLRLQPSAGSWNLNPSATASFPFNAHLYGQPSLSPTAERAIVPLTRFGGTINPYGGPPLGFAGSSLELLSSNPGVSFSLPAVGSRRTLAYEGRTAWDPRGTRAVFYTVSVDSQDVSTQSYQAQTTVLSFNGTSVNATTAPLEPGRWPISAAWSDEGERLTLIDAGHAIVPGGPFVPFTDCRIRNFHVTSSRSLIQLSSGAIDQRSCTYFTALDLPWLDNPARWGVWCLEWSPCQGNSGGNGDDDGSGGGGGGGGGVAGRITRAPAGLRARSIRIPALSRLCRSGRPIVSSSICLGSADPVVPKL